MNRGLRVEFEAQPRDRTCSRARLGKLNLNGNWKKSKSDGFYGKDQETFKGLTTWNVRTLYRTGASLDKSAVSKKNGHWEFGAGGESLSSEETESIGTRFFSHLDLRI